MKYHFFKRTSFFFFLFFFIISLSYFLVPAQFSLRTTYYLMSVIVLIVGLFKFTMLDSLNQSKKEFWLDLSEAVISMLFSVICMNFGQQYFTLSIILGVFYLIIPIIRLFQAKFKVNQLFIDSYKYLAGFVWICSNPHYVWWIKYVLGLIFLIFALLILTTKLIHLYQYKKEGVYYE